MNLPAVDLAWANNTMRKLEEEMRCASVTDASVFLSGESGVGKRFTARMIHRQSRRRRAPFVVVNASEAVGTDRGELQSAGEGTLLIQDIEKIAASAQWSLLRFMDRTASAMRPLRLMTATTTRLFELVQTGQFRDDLFYRLNVIHFTIPPLRERREDIPLMFHHYLSLHAPAAVPRLSNAARRRLVEYAWPGNIAELRTVAKNLSAVGLPDVIGPEHLPGPIGD